MTVLPGAEAIDLPGGRVGVLISHGFTGTPQSIRPWAEHLAAEHDRETFDRLAFVPLNRVQRGFLLRRLLLVRGGEGRMAEECKRDQGENEDSRSHECDLEWAWQDHEF